MKSHPAIPSELKFLRFVIGLGACFNLLLLIIGLLAILVGMELKFFSGDPGSLTWTFNFLAYGILGTFVSIRVFQLLHHRDNSSPRLIVMWVWWLVLGEIVLGFGSYLNSGVSISLFFSQIQNLILWSFFYIVVSSQMRFLKVVRDYYEALAPPSPLAWMNRLEQWMLQTMKLEQDTNAPVSQSKD